MQFINNLFDKTKGFRFNRGINNLKEHEYQTKTLRKLLKKAQFTEFGKFYNFTQILEADDICKEFKDKVPAGDYIKILPWWERCRNGEPNITWPGKVEFFAVSSGTTDNSSKYIPITDQMYKAIQRGSIRHMMYIAKTDIPKDHIVKNWLMMGGSTDLDFNGIYHSGDLSGITTSKIPFMLRRISKPEPKIKLERNWPEKISKITREAVKWDVGMIAGVPAWIQLLFESILEHYKISNIHEIWPNLEGYVHGGVSIKPYKKSIDKLLGRPIKYFETYLASEGFIAFQTHENSIGMRLLFKNGIYFEFVPFNSRNFDENGNLVENPQTFTLNQVDEKTDYALLLSTCAGAWRYLIGDVVRFTSLKLCEIEIVGRTKHFISLCGEHLSVENMNDALELASNELGENLIEYTVSGMPHNDGFFAHQWYIGYDGDTLNPETVKNLIDKNLKKLNDDYRVERTAALKDIFVELIPNSFFIEWMKNYGKIGAQTKFPRVLNELKLESWKNFLQNKKMNKN